jgi:hypothetical protein
MEKGKYFLLFFILCVLSVLCGEFFSLPVLAAQQAIGVNYFEIIDPCTCWIDKSSVYLGSPATFTQGSCGEAIPVDMSVGKGCLVFQTTRPGSGPPWGWWTSNVRIKDWPTVNFMRYGLNGQKPYLYLRVRWGQIASGAGLDIGLQDNHDIWNNYQAYAGQTGTYSSNLATVHLSTYIPSPVINQWYDINGNYIHD